MNRNGNDVPSSPLYTFYELLLPEFTEINSDGENLKQSELSSSKDEANNEMVTNNNIPHPMFHRLVFNSRNEIISTIDDYFSQFDINNQDLAQHNSIFTKSKFYINGRRLSLEEYDTSDIIKILIAAGELCFKALNPSFTLFLIRNKKN
ncbi:hypothetical protein RhiirC2_775402 [Rhizophagus irregularis]|uniref:Uncharacterized protein n=1 Tax=Rhizophagus irregularis TaxID=588596 RepID=A0A2N1NJ41_9GLOM|nr:hypothetical protein RhiirC2_775402 [Rhizophagus irregularis]